MNAGTSLLAIFMHRVLQPKLTQHVVELQQWTVGFVPPDSRYTRVET